MTPEPRKRYASPKQIVRAREVRQTTKAEVILWSHLQRNRTGFRFRRQHPIGPYIADFACFSTKLVVEIDGQSHDGRGGYDSHREEQIRREGWRIARYLNTDVLNDVDSVVTDIVRHCQAEPPPYPPPEGEETETKEH